MSSVLKLLQRSPNKYIFNKLYHYSNRTIRTLHQRPYLPLTVLNTNSFPNKSFHRSISTTKDKDDVENESEEPVEEQVEESDESEEHVEPDDSEEQNQQIPFPDKQEKSGNFCSRLLSSMFPFVKRKNTQKLSTLFSVGTKDTEKSNDNDTLFESDVDEHNMNQITELQQKLEEMESELNKFRDALARSQADKVNIQNMNKKDIEMTKKFATKNFSKNMLGVADALHGCIDVIDKDLDDYKDDKNVQSVIDGVKITHRTLLDTFSRNGINKIDSLHQEFDPNYHEALFKMPTSEHPPDCVVQVISEGYTLKDTVLRAAKVGISVAPPQPIQEAEETPETEDVQETETEAEDNEDKKE